MTSSQQSERTTEGIRITAAAEYMPQEALPREFYAASLSDDDHDVMQNFVFRYKITMSNIGEGTVRLLSRHWLIVDGEGQREEVRGRGVVGEHPSLAAGEDYSYVSYCPLPTAWGTMEGSYTFEREDGTRFDVAIGRFFLVPSAPPLKLEPQSR
jgi:ApaG protein